MPPLHAIVLAAGQGTRMKSAMPKVLHRLAGAPLAEHVVRAARILEPAEVHVVYGHGGDQVPDALAHLDVDWVKQAEQLGTGHAVDQAMPGVPDDATVLVLYADVPLVEPDTLRRIVAIADAGALGLMTVTLDDPAGYGRILRDGAGAVTGIVEHRDASEEQIAIREVNTGILSSNAGKLRRWLAALGNDNAQGEYYLTDVIAAAVSDAVTVETVSPASRYEVLGVNDRIQLAELERVFQARSARRLMLDGATIADPARIDIRGDVTVGRDVFIDVNVVFEGRVSIADGASVGPNCTIRDSRIGAGAQIRANSVLEGADVGPGCLVGPYARLRPGAKLVSDVHVGNFVEVKNTVLGPGAKANHLTYLGDSDVGAAVNVGAGTITCNYDGVNKHRTVIGDRAFIGSGAMLVAPVTIEEGATIGAGSTIDRDAPADRLTVARSRQRTIEGWKRPTKK